MTKHVRDSNQRSHSARVMAGIGLLKAEPQSRSSRRRALGLAGLGNIIGVCLLLSLIAAPAATAAEPTVAEPISPVPLELNLDQRKVQLGRQLFSDSRLSGGNGVSCASCHNLHFGLTDGQPLTQGLPGYPGTTNTLSLFNVGLSSMFGWNGQTLTLEKQVEKVVVDKKRMGANWDDVITVLRNDNGLTASFGGIYKDGLRRENVIDALVEYEKSLITPNAPFDRYLRGDQNAIGAEAKAGYQLFKDYGCASCHQGVNVGGNMLQVFGIFGTPKAAEGGAETPGSAQGSGIADDRPVFRVPVLRNVQYTAPYFHDGSAKTLSTAIGIMAKYQLGRSITDEDVTKLEAFLNSLTGEHQGVRVGDL